MRKLFVSVVVAFAIGASSVATAESKSAPASTEKPATKKAAVDTERCFIVYTRSDGKTNKSGGRFPRSAAERFIDLANRSKAGGTIHSLDCGKA